MRRAATVAAVLTALAGCGHGEAAIRAATKARKMLLDACVGEPEGGFVLVRHGDGEADVYGVPPESQPLTSLMFNHVAGDGAFDLIVAVARAADLVVLP